MMLFIEILGTVGLLGAACFLGVLYLGSLCQQKGMFIIVQAADEAEQVVQDHSGDVGLAPLDPTDQPCGTASNVEAGGGHHANNSASTGSMATGGSSEGNQENSVGRAISGIDSVGGLFGFPALSQTDTRTEPAKTTETESFPGR
jgi:hypothetical protein